MRISVVVPTHNRPAQLRSTVEHLLRSDVTGFELVDIVVVDDGSGTPALHGLSTIRTRPPFTLRVLYQVNAGAGPARNAGFRVARGDIVLFMDDDILASPDLLRRHVEAHRKRPGSVIFGLSPIQTSGPSTSLLRFLEWLYPLPVLGNEDFIETNASSGHLSVERRMFAAAERVYHPTLTYDEDTELTLRLRAQAIPLLLCRELSAFQIRASDLVSVCQRAQHHAACYAEMLSKCPDLDDRYGARPVILRNGPILPDDSFALLVRKVGLSFLSWPPVRNLLLVGVLGLEKIFRSDRILWPLYRSIMIIHDVAGLRDGLRRFPINLEALRQVSTAGELLAKSTQMNPGAPDSILNV
jgi:glycosyltransferase involved in cell wall biosynthesis